MERLVKCPKCGREIRSRGKVYFNCCQMAFYINKCLIEDPNDKIKNFRYRRKKIIRYVKMSRS